MKKYFTFLLILLLLGCADKDIKQSKDKAQYSYANKIKQPKNIILMIGDGMGLTQITAGMYMNDNYLELEEFPIVGLHKSHARNNLITDSAAGATAFACGEKTNNAWIAQNPKNNTPMTTILEESEARNMPTGLVTTSTIVHATPASFFGHVTHRKQYEKLARQMLDNEVDLFIGGGQKYFERRKDKRNITKELEEKGYYMSNHVKEDLEKVKVPSGKNFGFFTADADPLSKEQGRDYLPYAAEFSINFLKKRAGKEGFFLMVEGAQIDWGGHANKSDYIITEMLDFNETIKNVLDFAKKDGNTLVIVTADHETGGYAINKESKLGDLKTKFTTDYHTATMIPVFAYGPGAELFAGIYDNTAIYHKMRQAKGWGDVLK